MCDRVGKLIEASLSANGHIVTMFDPLTINLLVLEKPFHWYRPGEEKPQILVDTHATG